MDNEEGKEIGEMGVRGKDKVKETRKVKGLLERRKLN
jgi:hypothetical protein